MSITDGFNTADSLGAMKGNVLQTSVSHGGVSIKIYAQECQGLAEHGEHGWYHIGFDVVVDATGEILDSVPYSTGSDEEHFGHYKQEQIAGVVAQCLADYETAYVNATLKSGKLIVESEWIATFKEVRDARKAQMAMQQMLMRMLLGGFDDDDSDDVGGLLAGLMSLLEDEDEPEVDSEDTDELIMGFNPFLAGPTDEGLTDNQ